MHLRLSAVLILFFMGLNVQAVNVQQFTRSSSLTYELIEDGRLSVSHANTNYDWLINLGVSYVDSPLTVKNSANSEQLDEVITNMSGIHLGLSYYLKPWLQFGAQTYFSQYDIANDSHTGFGDIELRAKIRLKKSDKYAFSVMPQITIPLDGGEHRIFDTSGFDFGTDKVLSDDGLGYGAKLIYERLFNKFQLAVNLGIMFNSGAKFVDSTGFTQIDYTKKLQTGFGIYKPMGRVWGLNFEFMRHWSNPFFNDDINQNEFFIGSSFGINKHITFFGGIGFGNLLSDIDGNDWRAIAGLKITPIIGSKDPEIQTHYKGQDIKVVAALKEEIKKCEGLKLTPITVLFYHDDDTISPARKRGLRKVASVIKKFTPTIDHVLIHGHTSLVGDVNYNKDLGQRRANNVKAYLEKLGVATKHIKPPESYGETKAIRPLEKFVDQKLNRRVEILILSKQAEGEC